MTTAPPGPQPREDASPVSYAEGYGVKVCAVVPAYNEGSRLTRVVHALIASPVVDAVIIVDDGSSDDTFVVAEALAHGSAPGAGKVRPRRLPQNAGKGAAMREGADNADGFDILLFLDADLVGVTAEHIAALIEPVASGKAVMTLGVFRGGRGATTLAQIIAPNISGQRAIRRDLFLSIPCVSSSGYGVELAITNYVLGEGLPVARVVLHNVTHPMKEEKLGFARGAWSRLRMYRQMLPFIVRGRRRAVQRRVKQIRQD